MPAEDIEGVPPHEPERSAAQICGLVALLAPRLKRVLELGCGSGRVLTPLVQAGHTVTGIDRDLHALSICNDTLSQTSGQAELIHAEFTAWLRMSQQKKFDAILCLGNTFMTIADVHEALEVLTRSRQLLAPGGMFIIDDLPQDFWPEVADGNWQTGLSDDGESQLLWHPHDSVFTIRRGTHVDCNSWIFKSDDVLYRMWTSSALTMAAKIAGLSEPEHVGEAALLVLRAHNPYTNHGGE